MQEKDLTDISTKKKNVITTNDSATWKRILVDLLKNSDIQFDGPNDWDIQVMNEGFYKRVLVEGSLGLGESYMDGWWECKRLDLLSYRILKNKIELPTNWSDIFRIAIQYVYNLESKARALIVGSKHYNTGNDIFEATLDPMYMQYTCGYWKDAKNLDESQEHKLRLVCEKLGLKPGMKLLDIGCGWGGLAYYAAKNYKVSVVGITISVEQLKYAEEKCKGLDVEFVVSDYRDLNGYQFDRMTSIGMIEHVGPNNYRNFFEVARRNLKDDGIFLLHCLGGTKPTKICDEWTAKYIFSMGVSPSISGITSASELLFNLEDLHNFGADYDRTLVAWYENFNKNASSLDTSKYDDRFKRMWTYYLLMCAGGFKSRSLNLWQFVFTPHGFDGGLRVAR
ncbi:hypothetical protein DFA_09799 [Cavenderia fasciculata]|uniref:Cyclopropane fatty acyl phospholipid synthase n=1 Tax=Cavenderia fasciculata TaxID=261658 RepID=F4QAR1_CACFS|nr:uncharacterized protein DFA_09799 [Cavenderia fasciculata]EGG14979.1 hypothetical protein DFA_09799 [Cavenderia fasciculata]|eukprot:XP_004351699.1 hypothetical protein DFA_09799 [Cavenderia fasciculata]